MDSIVLMTCYRDYMRERNKVLCSILTIFREFRLHMAFLQGIFSYFPASFKKLI